MTDKVEIINDDVLQQTTNSVNDLEAVKNFDFSEALIRRSFIRKVYAILTLQLFVSGTFMAVAIYSESTKNLIRSNYNLFCFTAVGYVASAVIISFCGEIRRKFPINIIILGIFTVTTSVFLAAISALIDSDLVLISGGLTALICIGLTLFAFQTKWDFTVLGGALLTGLLILISISIFAIFLPLPKVGHIALAGVGIFLFSIYLIYDTQCIIGGKYKYSLSPEEYVFAALMLYLDIVNIFLRILRLLR